ncbi:MAG: CTP synthase [Pseudomonas sp.]|nr:MAG: CTP synthase [Pseudomonas sp.]
MRQPIRIGLIGDRDSQVLAHWAIPLALQQTLLPHHGRVQLHWLATERLARGLALGGYSGLWCVPGSPYHNTAGALRAITHARTRGIPFLGTCAGFQHALLERARNVLGWHNAVHAEESPEQGRQVISALSCGLVEASETLRLTSGSRLATIYHCEQVEEGYRCRYSIAPAYQAQLLGNGLRVAARGEDDSVRAIEATDHPFFIATLFQPERKALVGAPVPLVEAFVRAAFDYRHTTAEESA